jgi:hypothetical protein
MTWLKDISELAFTNLVLIFTYALYCSLSYSFISSELIFLSFMISVFLFIYFLFDMS